MDVYLNLIVFLTVNCLKCVCVLMVAAVATVIRHMCMWETKGGGCKAYVEWPAVITQVEECSHLYILLLIFLLSYMYIYIEETMIIYYRE